MITIAGGVILGLIGFTAIILFYMLFFALAKNAEKEDWQFGFFMFPIVCTVIAACALLIHYDMWPWTIKA